jgi:predicted DNA-binding transcriptional regulator YafY
MDIRNMVTGKGDPRHSQLELLLLWEGRLNNARVRELFKLSAVRASEWIREFRDLHSRWMRWDSKTRSYHATRELYRGGREDARQLESAASLARYLALVGLPHAGPGESFGQIVCGAFPDLSTPQPRIFAILTQAARMQRTVRIIYRSMREPVPHERTISPHSIVRAGRRWHVRAYCSTKKEFRDYTLGRIVDAEPLEEPAVRREAEDEAWCTPVPVHLIAHPDLTPAQEALIRHEYFNETARRVQTCRGALVSYFIQDIHAAVDVKTQHPPEYQLAVENIKEVTRWLLPGR